VSQYDHVASGLQYTPDPYSFNVANCSLSDDEILRVGGFVGLGIATAHCWPDRF